MDAATQIRLTRELVDIDSTTGQETDAGEFIAAVLRALGYDVLEQPVLPGRFNVYARRTATPDVVFSTHFDCVPPFFASREEGGRLYGRGACDAKGILIAQIAAAERLHAAGDDRVGLLFVVGEERGSEGAMTANAIAPGSRYLINGEPTENCLGLATRGVYRVRLMATGRAAHSSLPELGESAIEKVVDALATMRSIVWPEDRELGRTYYTAGLIKGGVAPNVIPPAAEAEVMFRTVGDHTCLRELLVQHIGALVSIEDVLVVPPVRLRTVPGVPSRVFSFTTDIPFLDHWGAPLLYGPGSIALAHTADESVGIDELFAAVDGYQSLARQLF